jgi:hypothetical protein
VQDVHKALVTAMRLHRVPNVLFQLFVSCLESGVHIDGQTLSSYRGRVSPSPNTPSRDQQSICRKQLTIYHPQKSCPSYEFRVFQQPRLFSLTQSRREDTHR